MKKILLLATGGTIASQRTENGLAPLITSEKLLEYVPDASNFCTITTLQLFNLDSTNIRPDHWLMMAKAIQENYDSYDGFVISHGTDTMAYTAAALSYLIQRSPKPIVITGAQKPIDLDVTDARTNLLDSLRFASDVHAYGVTIVFDGKVIAGTRARKMRTKSYNAFSSINFPHLATIQDGRIVHYIEDKDPYAEPVFYHELNDKVFLLKLFPGVRADILTYIEDQYDAIIIESYGVGGLPSDEHNNFLGELDRLVKKGKTVVMTTQVIHEGSDLGVYQVGNTIKKQYGLLESLDMTLESTVTKLMWILGHTNDPAQIRKLFHTTVNHDMLFQV